MEWYHQVIRGQRVVVQSENGADRIILNVENLDMDFVKNMIREHNDSIIKARREGVDLVKNIMIDKGMLQGD